MPRSDSNDSKNLNCLKVTQVADCDIPQRYWDCIVKPGKETSPDDTNNNDQASNTEQI